MVTAMAMAMAVSILVHISVLSLQCRIIPAIVVCLGVLQALRTHFQHETTHRQTPNGGGGRGTQAPGLLIHVLQPVASATLRPLTLPGLHSRGLSPQSHYPASRLSIKSPTALPHPQGKELVRWKLTPQTDQACIPVTRIGLPTSPKTGQGTHHGICLCTRILQNWTLLMVRPLRTE